MFVRVDMKVLLVPAELCRANLSYVMWTFHPFYYFFMVRKVPAVWIGLYMYVLWTWRDVLRFPKGV